MADAKTNVRELSTSFRGRAGELASLEALFARGDRLVTVLGPAGCGKTRLAKRYAALRTDEFTRTGGIWFCDLTEALGRDGIVAVVAGGVRVSLTGSDADSVEALGRHLDARGPMLVVLDNCERVAREVAGVVTEWLATAGEARFLATSRERLGLVDERTFELRPLPVPQADEGDLDCEAVSLFVDRVQLVRPDYVLGDSERTCVAQIVRALDGLPLALELAAARVRVMSPTTLLGRLDRRFDVLADRRRGAPEHHATLRAAIDWSWALLEDWERAALAQCAAFCGGFTLEAAEVVLDLSTFAGAPSVLDAIHALRDKSLVYAEAVADSTRQLRLGLYESIREYASEKLAESGQSEAAFARHRRYFLGTGAALAERARIGSAEHCRRLEAELANLRAVHERELERRPMDALRAALLLVEIYRRVGPATAMASMLDASIERARRALTGSRDELSLLADGLLRRAWVHYRFEHPAEARAYADDALSLARKARDAHLQGLAEHRLGLLECETSGNPMGESLNHLEAARRHFEAAKRPAEEAWVLTDIAIAHSKTGQIAAARRLLMQALAIAENAGAEAAAADARSALGVTALELGLTAEAQDALDGAIAAFSRLGDSPSYFMTLIYRAFLHFECGEDDRAESIYREILERRASVYPFVRGQALAALGVLLARRGAVNEARDALDSASAQLAAVGGEWAASAAISRGHLDLAMARQADANGQDAAEYRASAERRLAAGTEWSMRSDEARIALRWLERAFETGATDRPYPRDALVVAEDAAWFRVPFGPRVEIAARSHERSLLLALLRGRIDAPGRSLTRADLLSAGWPGERLSSPRAGANRVYVAVSTLRQLGLRDLLRSTEHGYMLDPSVPTIMVERRRPSLRPV